MSNPTAYAAAIYIAWLLFLILLLVSYRSVLILGRKRAANDFDPNGADVSAFSGRLARAHANTVESFGVVCGPMLLALATGMTSITDGLACVVVIARLVQSSIHLVSTHNLFVMARGTAFIIQLAIAAYWMVCMLCELATKVPVAA